jgi:phosphate transport system regulatory protein PhoU
VVGVEQGSSVSTISGVAAVAPGAATSPPTAADDKVIVAVRDLNVYYGNFHAVGGVNFDVPKNQITALIGPSGCGKSTVLRCINRMNDLIPSARVEGEIVYHGQNIVGKGIDPVEVRRRIGMVFQKPNPFPKSIHENITWGAKINGIKGNMDELVESCLRKAALWDEVKDKLKESGLALSGGQQQRLCIARTLAINPDVVLMDEPCFGARPDLDAKDRGPHAGVGAPVHDRDRDAQHAAGRPRFRPDGVLLARGEPDGDARRGLAHPRTLHQPSGPADRGLHHRAIRLGSATADRRPLGGDQMRAMTRTDFAHQLEELRGSVVLLSSMVEKALARAVDSLTRQDVQLAQGVMQGDAAINEQRWSIEESALLIIATQQPIARDLRSIASAIHIVTDLERMADHAVGIAKIVSDIADEPLLKPLVDIPRMAEIARGMLTDSISAYIANDAEAARAVAERDDLVDTFYNQIYRELLTYMMADPSTINRATHLLWVAHNIERIGDRATNICERVMFAVTGEMVEVNVSRR